MKKKLLPGIVTLAVLLIAGLGMKRSMANYGDLSDVALQNVLALADGEDPEDPDPGEDDGDEGTSCLTNQTSSQFYIVCPGMGYSEWVTQHSFECKGKNGSCSGVVGIEGRMCSGLPYPPVLESSQSC